MVLIYIDCDHKSLPSNRTSVDCRLANLSRQNIDKLKYKYKYKTDKHSGSVYRRYRNPLKNFKRC